MILHDNPFRNGTRTFSRAKVPMEAKQLNSLQTPLILSKILRALAVAAAITTSLPAQAAPINSTKEAMKPWKIRSLKIHGTHPYCEWGPTRFHRHVPGIGSVPCDASELKRLRRKACVTFVATPRPGHRKMRCMIIIKRDRPHDHCNSAMGYDHNRLHHQC